MQGDSSNIPEPLAYERAPLGAESSTPAGQVVRYIVWVLVGMGISAALLAIVVSVIHSRADGVFRPSFPWILVSGVMLLAAALVGGITAIRGGDFFGWFDRLLSRLQWIALALAIPVFGVVATLLSRMLIAAYKSDESGVNQEVLWALIWTVFALAVVFAVVVATKAIITGDAGITLKQMRQRALGTWLTLLSVLLGVALAVAVLLINRESGRLFGQTDFGYELIIGPPKGSKLTLVLNTVYHMEQSEGNIPYSLYEEMSTPDTDFAKQVRMAVPFLVGDSYKGRRIVGTSPQMLGYDDNGKRMDHPWKYREDKSYELAEGRPFHPKRFEAVLGSEVAQSQHMHVYDPKLSEDENFKNGAIFQATHGMPAPNETPDIHKPKWHVVGILQPTNTANDHVLFIPVISLYSIEEHSYGLMQQALIKAGYNPSSLPQDQLPEILTKLGFKAEIPASVLRKFRLAATQPTTGPASGPATVPASQPAAPPPDAGGDLLHSTAPPPAAAGGGDDDPDAYHLDAEGNIIPDLPKDEWELSAILVKARGPFQAETLLYNFRVAVTDAQAVSPARTMREFFQTFLKGSTYVLLALAGLVSVVAAVSILVSIYNSVSARQKEIAILRALGATRGKVLSLICLEAGVVGLVGGILGFVTGHLVGAAGSGFFQKVIGEGINWWDVDRYEILYLAGVVLVAVIAGLVPALKAYRVPVVTNLVA